MREHKLLGKGKMIKQAAVGKGREGAKTCLQIHRVHVTQIIPK